MDDKPFINETLINKKILASFTLMLLEFPFMPIKLLIEFLGLQLINSITLDHQSMALN